MFSLSATVNAKRIKGQLQNYRALTTGIVMQFLLMPILGFAIVKVLKPHGLTMPMGIALLIVTSSPGGSYSNWWCSLFNADLALSVAMTALSTVISVVALPANLLLYTHLAYGHNSNQEKHNILESVDFLKLLTSLSIIIAAILSGLYTSSRINSSRFNRLANAFGTVSGILLVVLSGIFNTAGNTSAKLWNQNWSFYVGIGLPCIIGLAIANKVAKSANLKKPERMTLSVECSYQNTGVATTIVLTMFNDQEKVAQAMTVLLFYGLMEMSIIGIYCLVAWKLGWTKAPKDENICIVMTESYEVKECDISALRDIMNENNKDSRRDRLDTLESDDAVTMTMSFSDGSGGYNGLNDNSQNSSKRNKATSLTTSETIMKQSRSCHQWGDNDVEVLKAFQTIDEESEDALDLGTPINGVLKRFPKDAALGTVTNCWSPSEHQDFSVRGETYLKNRVKKPSKDFIFPARGVEIFQSDCCPRHIGR